MCITYMLFDNTLVIKYIFYIFKLFITLYTYCLYLLLFYDKFRLIIDNPQTYTVFKK